MSSPALAGLERELEQVAHPEAERVRRWRLERLIRLGYDETSATELAAEAGVDVHDLERVLELGATLDQARRILQ